MDVFVYGTLTAPDRVAELLDSFVFVGPATLRGLRVVDGEYPTLAPPTGATADDDRADVAGGGAGRSGAEGARADSVGVDDAVAGRLLRTDEVAALDRYERVDDGLYVRVSVPVVDGDRGPNGDEGGGRPVGDSNEVGDRNHGGDEAGEAAVYVGDPDRLGAAASWPGAGPFEQRVRRYVDRADVRVIHEE
ncbi:gamma-glutamylcyclotransferase family protein [Halobaculum sp. P14]|uniref:gamma-glutamylcyclotransferase family protein n=1 Tax=Halobaculum sp. P14 TaxID=3421638 RepID=UPI003EBD1A14